MSIARVDNLGRKSKAGENKKSPRRWFDAGAFGVERNSTGIRRNMANACSIRLNPS